jgi:hypothetical protein
VRGLSGRILAILVAGALALAIVVSYVVVVSQNPHPTAKPLYGPTDFVQP